MDRAIPCGSKICAKRNDDRRQEMHRDRVRNVRSMVDTREPNVAQMDHVRNNLKKEQMLEERYSEIDRENRILLKKMSGIMRTQATTPSTKERPAGPQSLNRDARKKELLRITKENQSILKRIQGAQPVYNHIEWEGNHRKNASYLKNCAEYPLVLRSARGPNRSSELVNLGSDGRAPEEMMTSRSERTPPKHTVDPGEGGEDVRHVLKEGMRISGVYYLVEMLSDGRSLHISAYDGDAQMTLELVVKEKVHRRLYRETNGDYVMLARRLRVENQQLLLDDGDGGSAQAAAAPVPAWTGGSDTEDMDAEAMMVYKHKSGSAGSVHADIDVNSTGGAQVRVRGLTASSGGYTAGHHTAR